MRLDLSFRQIESFYWVARLGSFSEAAVHLGATQPAISNRIRELEARIGEPLFRRGPRGIALSPAGRGLFDVAERMVELGDEFLARARPQKGVSGIVRIGAADTVALTWLPRLVTRLAQLHPALRVELFVDLSVSIHAKLAAGDLDVAFFVGSAPGPEFVALPLGSVRNAWMGSPLLGLPPAVTPAALAALPIVTHTHGSHLHRAVCQWFSSHGVGQPRMNGCSSLATMIEMTVAGLGVSVLPPVLVRERHGPDRLVEIAVDPAFPATAFTCVHVDRAPVGIYRAIVRMAREEVACEASFQPADGDRSG